MKRLTIGIAHPGLDATPFSAAVVSFLRTVFGDASGTTDRVEKCVGGSIAAMVRDESRCVRRGHCVDGDQEEKYTHRGMVHAFNVV